MIIDNIYETSLNKLVSHYLMSSYLYYELDRSIYTDTKFNNICGRLLASFDSITHPHKHLLDRESLSASTGYEIQYPYLVKHAAVKWYESHTDDTIPDWELIRAKYNRN